MADGSPMPDLVFYLCGAVIGAAGGTVQAASRTLMVYHVTPETARQRLWPLRSVGQGHRLSWPRPWSPPPPMPAAAQRIGISPLIVLFLIGLILLLWVNPKGEKPR